MVWRISKKVKMAVAKEPINSGCSHMAAGDRGEGWGEREGVGSHREVGLVQSG